MAECRRGMLIVTVEEDGASFFKAPTLRRARKDHVCGECRKTIPKGSDYVDSRIMVGRHSRAERRCVSCGVLSMQECRRMDMEDAYDGAMDAAFADVW